MELFKPKVVEFSDSDQFYSYAEAFVIDEMFDSIGEEGGFRLALAGGTTPLPLYTKLATNSALPWESVELYQTDERYTSPTTSESNQYNIDLTFSEVIERIKHIYYINTTLKPDQSVMVYNEIIDSLESPLFDLTILGIGQDGHIASLFPNGEYLGHQESYSLITQAPIEYQTNASQQRISLTVEALLDSKKILILLDGTNKADVLSELISGTKPAIEFPAKFLLAHPNVTLFYLETAEKDEDTQE